MLTRTALSLLRLRGPQTTTAKATTTTILKSHTLRPFSILTPHRPSLHTYFSPPYTNILRQPTPIPISSPTTISPSESLDLLPRISSSPALRFLQLRNGPRNTFDPSHFVRKRRFGFLARLRTRTGRAILKRRRAKGRKSLSH
ncbi:ribosomal protein L34-domain-containing protein [Terfezia claveryi]|nr:ribosomal protein L34-domain-containing protein [Terfezia claveryi]